MNTRERRYKWVGFPPELVVEMLTWQRRSRLLLPVLTGLPDDCEVVDLFHDFKARELRFLLWSGRFPVVPDGMEAPPFDGPCGLTYQMLQFTQPDPDGPLIVSAPPA